MLFILFDWLMLFIRWMDMLLFLSLFFVWITGEDASEAAEDFRNLMRVWKELFILQICSQWIDSTRIESIF